MYCALSHTKWYIINKILKGKLNNIEGQNINEDDYLKELEREAYEYGNGLLFRGWENSIKGND